MKLPNANNEVAFFNAVIGADRDLKKITKLVKYPETLLEQISYAFCQPGPIAPHGKNREAIEANQETVAEKVDKERLPKIYSSAGCGVSAWRDLDHYHSQIRLPDCYGVAAAAVPYGEHHDK
ncbi:unnamed protein product [Enterobius vermicularis]|uniref:Phosphopyruvate hydratase n=1 Tax=Enterobius vermicularis TaxID=51028 RepID=A0A0N4V7F9_ENTVE|nr:unnamed protein product [Enterobius vermicularis]